MVIIIILLLLGICFWREAPETAVGPDRPACRSLLGLRSFSEVGGEDWRAGKWGLTDKVGRVFMALLGFGAVEVALIEE